ncbi:hypothetical protein Rsub_00940 [Raphidocelis subcapitata]|uniref:Uncharacterized protein n=1 Tax=Raphidocelis subcapitata TaxID=307507 RepID=A0A2V0NLE3_9CHLO|nr:hypothetical protein Rsub_00940 [Raphidocelis subcapitata]|eukprot:GBF88228.1 hypothetical protein Rsub_00940 [Raphidocelis subcapitata]
MAVVPFRINGPSADPDAEERLIVLGPYTLSFHQRPAASGAARHLAEGPRVEWPGEEEEDAAAAASGRGPDLSHVGLVVWNSAVVLSELLLRRPPLGPWPGVRVLELGCGTGVAGSFLAAADARVVMTDLPHITPLALENAAANAGGGGAAGAPLVVEYAWGAPASELRAAIEAAAAGAAGGRRGGAGALASGGGGGGGQQQQRQQQWQRAAGEEGGGGGEPLPDRFRLQQSEAARAWLSEAPPGLPPEFDFIIAADCLYEPAARAPLLASLAALSAPHTQAALCYRRRGLGEEGFASDAEAAGWAVQEAPPELLHPEFQGGEYVALLLARF